MKQLTQSAGTAPAVVVTALTAHAVLHTDIRVSLLAGAAAGVVFFRPQALLTTLMAIIFTATTMITLLCGVVYVLAARKSPSDYFMPMLAKATNYYIALKTKTPVKVKDKSKDKRHHLTVVQNAGTAVPAVSSLPPAQESVQAEDTPQYWKAMQAMVSKPGGRPDIVSQSTTTIRFPSATGRHAKPEADPMLGVYEDLQAKTAS